MGIPKIPTLLQAPEMMKNHIARSMLKLSFIVFQQKLRRVPLHLIEKLENEFKKLMVDKKIINLDKCSDKLFKSCSNYGKKAKRPRIQKIRMTPSTKNNIECRASIINLVAACNSESKNSPRKYFFSTLKMIIAKLRWMKRSKNIAISVYQAVKLLAHADSQMDFTESQICQRPSRKQ